jgi:hypothetical protein
MATQTNYRERLIDEELAMTKRDLKTEIKRSLSLLRLLRDEVRAKMLLAGEDAKAEWAALEPKITEVELAAEEATEASAAALRHVVAKLAAIVALK